MIVISYKKRDGLDWFRMYKEFKDDDRMKSTAKAKSFITYCNEQNKKSNNNPKYMNFRIIVGGRRISPNELLDL